MRIFVLDFIISLFLASKFRWADRGKMLLLSGAVLLWQETMCREWYTLLLQPWVHYVPVDYHFKGGSIIFSSFLFLSDYHQCLLKSIMI